MRRRWHRHRWVVDTITPSSWCYQHCEVCKKERVTDVSTDASEGLLR